MFDDNLVRLPSGKVVNMKNILDSDITELGDIKDAKHLHADLCRRLKDINGQLAAARSRVWASGEYSDPVWFKNADGARRLYGFLCQRVQEKIGQLGKAVRDANRARDEAAGRTFERAFVNAAKNILPDGQYRVLAQMAIEALKGEQQNENATSPKPD